MEERFERFTVLIARISRSIRRIKSEEMADFDLKSPHVSCLYYLFCRGALTAKELCELCDEDKAAISRSVEYLEERGYVEGRGQGAKRYKCPIKLTDAGLAVGRYIAERIDRILDAVGQGMSDEERVILYRGLTCISENLQAVCDQYDTQ